MYLFVFNDWWLYFVKPVTRWTFNYKTFVNKTLDKIIIFVLYVSRPWIMKRKFKQLWTSIPPISTKLTITSHLKALNMIKRHMMLEIQVLAWDKHKNVAGLKDVVYLLHRVHLCVFSKTTIHCLSVYIFSTL